MFQVCNQNPRLEFRSGGLYIASLHGRSGLSPLAVIQYGGPTGGVTSAWANTHIAYFSLDADYSKTKISFYFLGIRFPKFEFPAVRSVLQMSSFETSLDFSCFVFW